MIMLKSNPPKRPRRPRARWLLLLLLLAPVAGLVGERWRGQSALQSWKRKMAASGEIFEPTQLWPPLTAVSVEFSDQLKQVSKMFPARLQGYAGRISSMVVDESGQARRGSQAAVPAINPQDVAPNQTYTWQELKQVLQQSQPALQHLRELMKDPPAGGNYDVAARLENDSLPNFASLRVLAQTLQASALNQLHNGHLNEATADLEALLAFRKLGEQDPTLVSFMIRMAIMGLSVDVCWDALQADGWTEPQLAALQSKCLAVTNVLSQLPRVLEAERIARIYQLNWFRAHSYHEWVARYQELYAGFGVKLSATDASGPVRVWREWIFHPLWRFAWADQEELKYLQDVQPEVAALRESPHRLSYSWLMEKTATNHKNYRLPTATWRFYTRLPLVDNLSGIISGSKLPDSLYPYPDFSKAWLATLKNLTLHQMVITAIAVKRYELKHGKSPVDLAALVPEFLPALPRDLMDGKPLRYRLESNGSTTLYSVGEDAQDDGGMATSGPLSNQAAYRSHWSGKDWVWPEVVAGGKGLQLAQSRSHSGGE